MLSLAASKAHCSVGACKHKQKHASTVVDAVMGEEMERMQSEFNLDMHVFAVAERGVDGRGRMLLSVRERQTGAGRDRGGGSV